MALLHGVTQFVVTAGPPAALVPAGGTGAQEQGHLESTKPVCALQAEFFSAIRNLCSENLLCSLHGVFLHALLHS